MMKRSHHCAQLRTADIGAAVSLSGWVDSIRDHGGIIFIDLRDRKGVTQFKFDPKSNAELGARAGRLRPESVASVAGKVVGRPGERGPAAHLPIPRPPQAENAPQPGGPAPGHQVDPRLL